MANTTEELEAQRKANQEAAEAAVEEHVTEVGEEARKDAEKAGATPEEVQAQVEKARKEEKDKLYPQINEVKNSLKEVQELLRAEREDKERIQREREQEKERERQATLSDSEKQLEALNKIEEQLKQERKERLELQADIQERDRANTLETYKQNAIKAAGDEIIPELVIGNTKAEIDAAIEIAKARYAEYHEKIKAELGETTRKGMPRSTSPNTEALEEQELDEQLAQVDQDKYLKDPEYRTKIQKEIETAYQRASGRL